LEEERFMTEAFARIPAAAILSAAVVLTLTMPVGAGGNDNDQQSSNRGLVLTETGNRTFGGKTIGDPRVGLLACDHGYVSWSIPKNPRKTPLLFIHASSMRTWLTTFDLKRDGFVPVFLRRGYKAYWTDLPRTGQAGQGCAPTSYEPQTNQVQSFFNSWRLGLWLPGEARPTWNPGVQFPTNDAKALDQFNRVQTPEFNAPENEQIETDALAVLLGEIGPAVMLTHSSTGIRGWIAGTKSNKVAGIVSYEPGNVVFPAGEVPPDILLADGTSSPAGNVIPMADFLKLTKFPIQIIWGDYIPKKLDPINVGPRLTLDTRRRNVLRTKLFAEAIKRHGGDVEILDLPSIGIRGNTHWPMLDNNNYKIADLLANWLQRKRLDKTSGRDNDDDHHHGGH
jgi:hypothetical protein